MSNIVGGKVEPWNIKPGLLIESVGYMSQQATTGFNRNVSYISSINYTYPYQFQITSGDSGKLNQQLAKLGLGGL
ncbi:MAG: hypothetical protein HC874_30495 [Richelia sp. SL_2_1]|nr:hypothetical protein [Richelia sp. SL_2_1]